MNYVLYNHMHNKSYKRIKRKIQIVEKYVQHGGIDINLKNS